MGWFSAVSGAVSSAARHTKTLVDPRKALKSIDPRTAAKAVTTGRLPGASTMPGASSLLPGVGLTLKDRIRVRAGNPNAIAKAILTTAQASQSSRWAPQGFAKGMGPLVSNIASASRAGIATPAIKRIKLLPWW